MSSENSEISTVVKNTYQDIYDTFCAVPDSSVVIAHFGRFSQDLVNSISEGVENILISNDVKKNMIKRMFSVLIEGLQNIRIHGGSDADDQQIGHVIVLRGCADYRVSFGSYASEEDRSFLTKHLDNINEKSLEEVKAFYLDVLSKGFLSNKGGEGLGFITIALTSKSAIYYAFHPTDYKDLYYFDFSVELNID